MGNKADEVDEKELERLSQYFKGKGILLQQSAERHEADPIEFRVDLLRLLGAEIINFLHRLTQSVEVGYVIGPKFTEGEIKANSAYFKFSEIRETIFPLKDHDDLWLRVKFVGKLKNSSSKQNAIIIMKERILIEEMTVSHLSETFSKTISAASLFLEQMIKKS